MSNFDDLFNQQESSAKGGPELPAFDKEAYKARKKEDREMAFNLIDSALGEMKDSGEVFQSFLDVQARFDRYSVSNAVLITAQYPEATGPLKTYDEWKASGNNVSKGADAILLLEPGKEYSRDDGSTSTLINVKKVFDVSQTRHPTKPRDNMVRDERLLLKSLISHAPCNMKISDNLPQGKDAAYSPDEKTIFVRSGMDSPNIFLALTRELAHAHMDKGDQPYRRADHAATAYYVSYLLCKRYGVPADSIHFDKMPESYSKMDVKQFRSELSQIRQVVGEISRDMSRILNEKSQDKKEHSDTVR